MVASSEIPNNTVFEHSRITGLILAYSEISRKHSVEKIMIFRLVSRFWLIYSQILFIFLCSSVTKCFSLPGHNM